MEKEKIETRAEDILQVFKDGFIEIEKKTDKKIDHLAEMIQGEFLGIHKRFDVLESDVKLIKAEVVGIKYELTEIKEKLDYDREKIMDLEKRISRIEAKLGL